MESWPWLHRAALGLAQCGGGSLAWAGTPSQGNCSANCYPLCTWDLEVSGESHKLYRCFVTFEWQCVLSALCINPLMPCLEEKLWPHLANSSSSEVMRHHEPGRGLLYNEVMITWARKLNYTEIWIISFSHIPTPHHAHLPNSSNAKYLGSLVSGFWKLP